MKPLTDRVLFERRRAEASSAIVSGFMPSVLERIHSADAGLVIWRRFTRLNLLISASALLMRPPFTLRVIGTPTMAARRLCHDLMLFQWLLYTDFRRLAARFATLAASPVVQMRLEHVTDDACCRFHVDAVGLRLLCTYAGPGTEWMESRGKIRRMTAMEVAVFKGSAYAGAGPRVLHRSAPVTFVGRGRLVLCIDTCPDGFAGDPPRASFIGLGRDGRFRLGWTRPAAARRYPTSSIKFDLDTARDAPTHETPGHTGARDGAGLAGFGDQPRPPVAWTPEALSSFLDYFAHREIPALLAPIAAGHAATYALYLAARSQASSGGSFWLLPLGVGRCRPWRTETDASVQSGAWLACQSSAP